MRKTHQLMDEPIFRDLHGSRPEGIAVLPGYEKLSNPDLTLQNTALANLIGRKLSPRKQQLSFGNELMSICRFTSQPEYFIKVLEVAV